MQENQRVRSPRYPAISLQEAEGVVKKIYGADGMNSVDRETAVLHMGYKSLNGASATVLASLKQFGLTTDVEKGMLRLTPLVLDLLEPESPNGRAKALMTSAFKPELFAALRDRFPQTPSESNLRAHLLRQSFTQVAAKVIVPAYLETCEYVASAGGFEGGAVSPLPTREMNILQGDDENALAHTGPTTIQYAVPSPNLTSATTRRMVFDTEEGEVMFTFPDALSDPSVDDLEEWFALVVKRLRRASKH